MEGRAAPVIVNNSLEGHPLVGGLSKISKFRPIMSGNTPQSSLIFPSLKASCLIVDLEVLVSQQDQFQTIMETCLHFISTNTRPFILLTPSDTTPGRNSFSSTDCYSSVNNLIFQLSLVSTNTPVVVQAWSEDMAVRSILYLVFKAGKGGEMLDTTDQLPSEREVRARLISALNQSRVVEDVEDGDCQSLLDQTLFLANLPKTYSNLSHKMKSALEEDRSF